MPIDFIRKDYPTTGVLRLTNLCISMNCPRLYQEGLPDYWGIETVTFQSPVIESENNQEGLPDYWGIETSLRPESMCGLLIRKDYPTTGVLRLMPVLPSLRL